MNIKEELDNEIRIYRQFGFSVPNRLQKKRRDIGSYEKPYSAKKPLYCYVKVEYCLDCTEPKCTYKRCF